MSIQQVAIFLENKCGRLADVTRVLQQAEVNLRAVSLADNADFGILRLIVNDPAAAMAALKAHGYTATVTDVVAVEVDDQPGGLQRVLEVLQQHNMNVEYMYAFVNKSPDTAVLIMRFDDPAGATNVLRAAGVLLIGAEALSAM